MSFAQVFLQVVSYFETLESLSLPILSWNSGRNSLNISVLDLCGSLLVCYRYKNDMKYKKSWFEAFIACTLMQFGGTTLTGLLLGKTRRYVLCYSAIHTAFYLLSS